MVLSFFIVSCAYSVYTNAYPHIKNIQILSFENKTPEYQISQEFHDYLVNKFQKDGRLKITTLSSDSQIEGSVNDYKKEILSYDNNGNITEYKISILFSVSFTDIKMNTVIYNNSALLVSESYSANFAASSTETASVILTSEQQAQEKIYEKVFDTIMKNSLEKW